VLESQKRNLLGLLAERRNQVIRIYYRPAHQRRRHRGVAFGFWLFLSRIAAHAVAFHLLVFQKEPEIVILICDVLGCNLLRPDDLRFLYMLLLLVVLLSEVVEISYLAGSLYHLTHLVCFNHRSLTGS